jgi:cytochrome c oxidase cbb3-type subunit 2
MVVMAMGVVLGLGWKKAKPEGGLQPDDAVVRGREVYVSEGCIHCHSQYVRPGSVDEQMWGPANAKVDVLSQQPVLIGNRRQGPDLSHVGIRRSALWLKAHFMDPQQLVPDSVMPSYGYLFRDQRGDDLVSYLKSLGTQEQTVQVWQQALKWEMDRSYPDSEAEGKALYERQCAVCHGAQGDGGGALAAEFVKRPTNLRDGPFGWTVNRGSEKLTRDAVSRVIKYGLPGTDMPGHETLQDRQISALTDWILKLREKPAER